MKKIFFCIVSLISLASYSQMTLKKLDGTPINDGDVITFNVATDPESYLGIKIYNGSDQDINVKAKCMSIVNATGTNLQFCINPVCVSSLVVGANYPASAPSVIPANGENGNFDHLVNMNTGTVAGQPVLYTMKFYMLDENNAEIGNSVTFTYKYDANAASVHNNSLESLGLKLNSNVISNTLDFESTTSGMVALYDLNGKQIAQNTFSEGINTINIVSFATGMYIASFTDNKNRTATVKLIKN